MSNLNFILTDIQLVNLVARSVEVFQQTYGTLPTEVANELKRTRLAHVKLTNKHYGAWAVRASLFSGTQADDLLYAFMRQHETRTAA
jgi:hypothetical protein